VSEGVIEVGPAVVRGAYDAEPELVSAAIEYIDDDLGLLDARAVSVAELWSDLMLAVVGADVDAVVLACPTWWSTARIDRVRRAAEHVGVEVAVTRRAPLLLGDAREGVSAVVEIAAEVVVVARRGADAAVIPILGDRSAVAAEVHAAVGVPAAVMIDVPAGVEGGGPLGEAIMNHLRANGIAVTLADEDAVRRAAEALHAPEESIVDNGDRRPDRRLRAMSAAAGVAAAVAVCGGFAIQGGAREPAATTLLVEGRVGVVVPVGWPVQRITSGPGSARLQIVSPSHDDVALHITQSRNPPQADLAAAAESLRMALADEQDDAFVDFEASDLRVGRPAVTYREVRRERQVAWTMLVDQSVRIAIGCQSAPAREDLVRDVCDQAIRSAHAVS
jgi:type VII secretion-associated protein (TIGR03931 family)